MFKMVVGHSNDLDSFDAVSEIISQCNQQLNGLVPQAGILFSAIGFDYKLILSEINKQYPEIELIGCLSGGEISSILQMEEDSITLILFYSDKIKIKAGLGRKASENPYKACQEAVKDAGLHHFGTPAICLTTPDGTTINACELVNSFKELLEGNVPIFGGTSVLDLINNDNKTYQFYKDKIVQDSVPILLFYGKLTCSFGVGNGWQPISKKEKITKIENGEIYKIGDKPALEYFKYYLGDDVGNYVDYPLAILDKDTGKYFLRAVLKTNPETNSITLLGRIPEGTYVQIADSTRNDVISAAESSFTDSLENYNGKNPAGVLVFSCAMRKMVLGTRTIEEYLLIKKGLEEKLQKDIPVCGFYSFGEICPFEINGKSIFHCETMISLIIGED